MYVHTICAPYACVLQFGVCTISFDFNLIMKTNSINVIVVRIVYREECSKSEDWHYSGIVEEDLGVPLRSERGKMSNKI
jgi:hypothetical protein